MEEGSPFRVALIDLELAQLDGVRVEQQVLSEPDIADTLMISLTSSPMRGDGIRVHRAGYSGYLVKPVQSEELRGVIGEVLRAGKNGSPPLVTRHTVNEQQYRLRTKKPVVIADVSSIEAPTRPAAESIPEPPPAPETEPEIAPKRERPRVLVAEDNAVNQKIAARLLQKVGLDVDVVGNGREAVEAWDKTSYDLILMDCQMPDMDGFEATEWIREREDNGVRVPICALTAHAMEADREKCLSAGMDHYLSKPIDLKKLTEAVDQLVHSKDQPDVHADALG